MPSERAWFEPLIDHALLPETVLRAAVRRRLAARVRQLESGGPGAQRRRHDELITRLSAAPIATAPLRANEHHYELPPGFFRLFLGPRLKYSSCLWPDGGDGCAGTAPDGGWLEPVGRGGIQDAGAGDGLAAAEEAMLQLTCSRAGIQDGMCILDLGCGWGSVSLWIAERFPGCRVTAVSNSRDQGCFIRDTAARRSLDTIAVHTADVSTFDPGCRFDRIVSVEMLEHVRNYPAALARIASWLEPDGACFVHVFSHRRFAYLFDESARGDWMARHFFAGGTMPSHDLLPGLAAGSGREHAAGPPSAAPGSERPAESRGPGEPTGCADDADHPGLRCVADWWLPGTHYARTLEAWRARYDAAHSEIMPILTDVYGAGTAVAWHARWRLFFISCAETFGFRGGREWGVSHYLFRPRDPH